MPVNFQAMLLQPNKKTMKKLREVLYDLYKHLDSSAAAIIDVSGFVIATPRFIVIKQKKKFTSFLKSCISSFFMVQKLSPYKSAASLLRFCRGDSM